MRADLTARLAAHNIALEGAVKAHTQDIQTLAQRMATCFSNKNRAFFFGNGGSACDAMHIAGEFAGRFVNDRKALPAIALSADNGLITAVANDYGYDYVFARQIEALCQEGDIAIGLSTSGKSPNVLRAFEAAQKAGAYTVLLTGEKGHGITNNINLNITVPSAITAHIQETHLFLLHSLAAMVEDAMGIN